MQIVALLMLGLFAPFTLLTWAHHDARRIAAVDPAAAWFSFAQRVQWIMIAGLLGWPMLTGTSAGRVLITSLHARLELPLGTLAASVLIVPPAVLLAWSGWLTEDVARSVRGIEMSRTESARNAVLRAAGLITPVVGLTCAFEAWRMGATLLGLLIACGALLIAVVALQISGRRAVILQHAVTSGPLRDRVFALAERAGVKLEQLYVVPVARIRMANAFAVQGNKVILTDYLLQHLDRDEVDAVLAHEMAHLKLGHPRMLGLAMLALLTAIVMGSTFWHAPGAAALILFPGLLAFFAMSRHFERGADNGALDLGVRPEALITGLVRLCRLNHVPMRWSMAREWLLTHPSTERRAHAIALHGGLTGDRVSALLADALLPGPRTAEDAGHDTATPPTAQSYAVPASVTRSKIFATPFKQRTLQRLGMSFIGVSVGLPVFMVASAAAYDLTLPRLTFIVCAALASALACVLLGNFTSTTPFRGLARPLAKRCADEGFDPATLGARFVGLTPDERVRIYEGFGVWDVGYLALGSGRLDYVGEEARFTLAAEDITGVALVPGMPGWIKIPGIRVDWRRPDGLSGSFGLHGAGAATMLGAADKSRSMFAELERWRLAARQHSQAAASRAPWMGPPPTTTVTSVPPTGLQRPSALINVLVMQSLIALLMLFVLRQPLWGMRGPGLLEVVVAAFGGFLLVAIPHLRWREPTATPARPPISAERHAA